MSYYSTLDEDVARAKEILARGRADRDMQQVERMDPALREIMQRHGGGAIFGVDTYAAYKLLESFVEAIEAVGPKVCELAIRHHARTVGDLDEARACYTGMSSPELLRLRRAFIADAQAPDSAASARTFAHGRIALIEEILDARRAPDVNL